MPVNIPDSLPASDILKEENIFVMNESQAARQDIRPLRIAILNLMPIKETTETHLLRMLSNTPLQVEVTLLYMKSHIPKNTSMDHLDSFYKYFAEVKQKRFDGLIITGAPIEHLEFEDVTYWKELQELFKWSETNVTSSLFICWGAQAAMYHFYGIKKFRLSQKLFGIYKHSILDKKVPLLRGFDDQFYAPHSRHTYTRIEDVANKEGIQLLSVSEKAGVYIASSNDGNKIFVTGHSEYDVNTLKEEYERDKSKGIDIDIPENYFLNNDPSNDPINVWKSHGSLLFSNWLNYYVYQATPYDFD